MNLWITSIRTCRSLLTNKCCRSHLTTCHTVNSIVNEDDNDVLSTVQGVNGLTSTDTSKVAITLIGEHQAIGPSALDTCGQCGCTSMGSLLPVDIYIVVGKHGTAYRRNTYSLICHTHLLDDLGNQLMYHTMATAWAVVHIVVVHQRRLFADDVLWLNYLISIHSLTLPFSVH